MTRIPDFDDVRAAARRLEGHARRTPLLADTPLDALTGGRILLNCVAASIEPAIADRDLQRTHMQVLILVDDLGMEWRGGG